MKSAIFYALFFVILCNYVLPRMIKSINSLFSSTVKTNDPCCFKKCKMWKRQYMCYTFCTVVGI